MPIIKSVPILRLHHRLLRIVDQISWLAPLLARITVGVVFMSSGWGKLHNLAKVTEFFESLKIPLPGANALFISSLELVGGCLVLIGLCSRLISLPLIATMGVAILTAKIEEVSGLGDLLRLSEWAYLVLFVGIALYGPGRASIDHLLAPRLFDKDKAA